MYSWLHKKARTSQVYLIQIWAESHFSLWLSSCFWLSDSLFAQLRMEESSLAILLRPLYFSLEAPNVLPKRPHLSTIHLDSSFTNFKRLQTPRNVTCYKEQQTSKPWTSTGGGERWGFSPSGNRAEELNVSRKHEVSSSILINWFNSCSLFSGKTHTAQEPGSRSWCHAVATLQFTNAPLRRRTWERILLLLIFIA